MELNYIHLSELFGDPIKEERVNDLGERLLRLPAFCEEAERALGKENKEKCAETLSWLWLLKSSGKLSDGAKIKREEGGKPFAQGGNDFEFSVAHSGGITVLATSKGHVGVDAERIRCVERRERLAERFFSENERKQLCAAADADTEFLRIWTKKEAYMKMKGTGLGEGILATDTSVLDTAFFEQTAELCGERYIITVCTDTK